MPAPQSSPDLFTEQCSCKANRVILRFKPDHIEIPQWAQTNWTLITQHVPISILVEWFVLEPLLKILKGHPSPLQASLLAGSVCQGIHCATLIPFSSQWEMVVFRHWLSPASTVLCNWRSLPRGHCMQRNPFLVTMDKNRYCVHPQKWNKHLNAWFMEWCKWLL